MPLELALFITSTSLVSLSPGLNSLAVVQCSMSSGFSRSLRVIAGQQASLATQMLLVATGVASLSPVVLGWLQVTGACYLIFVGGQLVWAGRKKREITEPSSVAAGFWRGYLVNAANPKALLFQAAFVPQFLVVGEPLLPQYLILGSIMLAIESAVMMGYAGMASNARQLIRSGKLAKPASILCGAMFAAVGAGMLFSMYG